MNPRRAVRTGQAIALRMALIVGTLVATITAVLVVLLHLHEHHELVEQATAEMEADLATRERLLRVAIDRITNDVRFLARTPPIAGIARSRDGYDQAGQSSLIQWQERLQKLFVAFAESEPAIRQVRLLDESGYEQVRVERHGAFVHVTDPGTLQDKSARPYFRQARALGPGTVYISPIELNREFDRIEEPHWATLRVAMAVGGKPDQPLSVVVINYEADAVLEPLGGTHSADTRFFIADAEDNFIMHPDPALVLRHEFAQPYRLGDAFPGLVVSNDVRGGGHVHDGETSTLTIAHRVSLPREVMNGQLTLVAATDPEAIARNSLSFTLHTLPIASAAAAGVFLVAWLMLRRQTAPLTQLAHAVSEISSGNLSVTIDAHRGSGEINALATAFGGMLESLRQRQQETERLYDDLHASEAFANAIIRGSPHGILVIGDDGLIVRSNLAADNIFGYESGALVGRPVEVLVPLQSRDIHPVRRAGFRPLDAPRLMKERGSPLSGQRADGSCFPAEIALANLNARDGRFVVATVSDTSELRERQARTELLASIVRNSGDFICICTPALTARYLNPAARKMLGLVVADDEEIDLTSAFDTEPRQRVRSEIVPALQTEGRWSGEVTIRHAVTGAKTHTMWNAFAIHDPDGTTTAWAVIGQDLAERRARASAEAASEAKSTFLAHMSHEMRTPLNAVMSVAYLLSRAALEREQQQLVDQLGKAAQQLAALINDVLDLSKIEAGKLELEPTSFALRDLLRDMVALMSHQAADKGLDLRLTLSPDLPDVVVGDPTRLNQVLANLLSNAIKFTERGSVMLNAVPALTQPDSVTIDFCVTDTGIGIAADAISNLFAPFTQADVSTTRRFGGTGLGLTICKLLIESMGGRISVSSEPGLGSEFSFSLPLGRPTDEARANLVDATPLPRLEGPALPGARILVVDDSDINRDIARRLLRLEGAVVGLAANGQEAIEVLSQNPGAVDVVLMDLQMPTMDGFEATRQLRGDRRFARLPIVALTAAALPNEREHAAAAGMDDFITKPIDPQRMVGVIREQLARRGHAVGDAAEPPTGVAAGGMPESWPKIDGIHCSDARSRLGGDPKLLRSLLRRMFDEFSDSEELAGEAMRTDPAQAARRLHKLRGIAGNLGANEIARVAGELETALRAGQYGDLDVGGSRLRTQLDALREAAAEFLGAQPDERPDNGTAFGPQPLAELIGALAANDLAALDQFAALAAGLRTHLGADGAETLQQAIEDLRFDDARHTLLELAERLETPTGPTQPGSL